MGFSIGRAGDALTAAGSLDAALALLLGAPEEAAHVPEWYLL